MYPRKKKAEGCSPARRGVNLKAEGLMIALVWALLLLGGVSLFTGCGTVAPPPVEDHAAAYDPTTPPEALPQAGTAYNSGVLWLTYGAKKEVYGAVLTLAGHDRLCGLVTQYGDLYAKETGIKLDAATVGRPFAWKGKTLWKVNAQELTAFQTLTRWRKEGRK